MRVTSPSQALRVVIPSCYQKCILQMRKLKLRERGVAHPRLHSYEVSEPGPFYSKALFILVNNQENLKMGDEETEDEMVGWHHQLDGPKFGQALGVGDGQESLVCCSPWDRKESDMTE